MLFDFDGTISTLRCGWEEVMLPVFMEFLDDGVVAFVALGIVGGFCQFQSGEGGLGDDQAVGVVVQNGQFLMCESGQVVVVLRSHVGIAQLCGRQEHTGNLCLRCCTACGEQAGDQNDGQNDGQ